MPTCSLTAEISSNDEGKQRFDDSRVIPSTIHLAEDYKIEVKSNQKSSAVMLTGAIAARCVSVSRQRDQSHMNSFFHGALRAYSPLTSY
jgi:hypothetical protein